MTGRYDSDYVARLPEGLPARCNPERRNLNHPAAVS